MWLNAEERLTLSAVGLLALLGCAVWAWRQQRPPVVVEASLSGERASQWDRALSRARRLDVNTAGAAVLERLPGVGPVLAARIVADREAHGAFGSVEELSRVQGMGPQTVERVRDYVEAGEE